MVKSNSSRFLLVKHSRGWNVDRCCRWLQSHDHGIDWCYPVDGDQFPDCAGYDGVIIFGGAGSANDCDRNDWVRRELAFIESILAANVPYFGICLGAQMLARVLGAEVSPAADKAREVGFHPVYPTRHSAGFLSEPLTVMQWHSEGFELPAGAVCVARGDVFPNQAFRYRDNVYAVQFHPEINPEALAIWQQRNRKRTPETGRLDEQTLARHMADAHSHDVCISNWLDGFMAHWSLPQENRQVI